MCLCQISFGEKLNVSGGSTTSSRTLLAGLLTGSISIRSCWHRVFFTWLQGDGRKCYCESGKDAFGTSKLAGIPLHTSAMSWITGGNMRVDRLQLLTESLCKYTCPSSLLYHPRSFPEILPGADNRPSPPCNDEKMSTICWEMWRGMNIVTLLGNKIRQFFF